MKRRPASPFEVFIQTRFDTVVLTVAAINFGVVLVLVVPAYMGALGSMLFSYFNMSSVGAVHDYSAIVGFVSFGLSIAILLVTGIGVITGKSPASVCSWKTQIGLAAIAGYVFYVLYVLISLITGGI